MPFEIIQSTEITGGGTGISARNVESAGLLIRLHFVIPENSADLELLLPVDVSQLLSVRMYSGDADLTIETNDGAIPIDTVELIAGQGSMWTAGGLGAAGIAALFGTDVTSIFVTSDTADTETTLEIDIGLDPEL